MTTELTAVGSGGIIGLMVRISAKDAAVLGYLARHKNAPAKRTQRLKSGMTGPALAIAKALTGQRSTKAAARAAKGLVVLARDNERIAASVVKRARRG